MKVRFASIVAYGGTVLAVLSPVSSPAQEFFRELGTSRSSGGLGLVQASDYSYRDASPSGLAPLNPQQIEEEENTHNFAIGPVRFSLAAGFGVEVNDNITLSDNGRESDVVLRPSLNLDATWLVSDMNILRFSVGASYAKYLSHSKYDTEGILLSPTSELAFTFILGEVKFTIRDRFSYQEDPYDIPVLSDIARYRRFENQIGVRADWEANSSFTLSGGYDHYNLWARDDIFSDQDRSIDTVFFKPSYALSPTLRIGLNTSASYINFNESSRGDGSNLMVGPFVEWQLSAYTNLYLEAGYQRLEFDGNGFTNNRLLEELLEENGFSAAQRKQLLEDELQDDSGSDSYYVRFEVNNEPAESFKHRFSASKTAEIGFLSNSYDLYHIEYNADWTVIRDTSIAPTVFYEYYKTSGSFQEKAHRIGAAIGVRHHLTNSITLGLDYRFLSKDSNLPQADYYQNLTFLSIYYKF